MSKTKIQKILRRREQWIIESVSGKEIEVFFTRYNDNYCLLRFKFGVIKFFQNEESVWKYLTTSFGGQY